MWADNHQKGFPLSLTVPNISPSRTVWAYIGRPKSVLFHGKVKEHKYWIRMGFYCGEKIS